MMLCAGHRLNVLRSIFSNPVPIQFPLPLAPEPEVFPLTQFRLSLPRHLNLNPNPNSKCFPEVLPLTLGFSLLRAGGDVFERYLVSGAEGRRKFHAPIMVWRMDHRFGFKLSI